MPRQQVAREDGDDLVAVDDGALRGHGEHAVRVAVEREPELVAAGDDTLAEHLAGAVEPQRSLMLRPSGLAKQSSASMPSPSNSRLATTLAAPFAQSTRIRRGRSEPPTASTTQSA